MSKFKNKIAFVVATKDRLQELKTMLESISVQSVQSDEIIIIDGGAETAEDVVSHFPSLNIRYTKCLPPSATRQRNKGIELVSQDITLVGFCDDDVVFEKDALAAMMSFWENSPDNLGGAAFNMVNHPELQAAGLKHSRWAERMGLYSKKRGAVLPSGFHSMIGYVTEDTFVDWLPTGAVVWHRQMFKNCRFDEWFEGYSYLEDLDFSYSIGKKYKLAVVADAEYYHYPSALGRTNSYRFGKTEVRNRLYFVRKNRLSLSRCYLGIAIRFLMTLGEAIKTMKISHFQRAVGNCAGIFQFSFLNKDRVTNEH